MKKLSWVMLVAGLVAGLGSPQAFAQGKKVEFSLNLGLQANLGQENSFEHIWPTLDLRAGIRLGESIRISPEFMAVVFGKFESDFGYALLYPAVMLNYTGPKFFVGAGVVLPIWIGDGIAGTENPAPKINLGWKLGKFMLTAYAIIYVKVHDGFYGLPKYTYLGTTAGYRF